MRPALLLLVGSLFATGFGCAHGRAAEAMELATAQDAMWSCQCLVTGMATGYDEEGGEHRIWLADDREVRAVVPGGEPVVLWTAPRFTRILRLEAGDLDGDGSDEWLVLFEANSLRSVVVGLRNGRREALSKPWNGYLRMLVDSNGQSMLVGQSSAGHRPFWGPIYPIELSAEGKLSKGEPLSLPAGTGLFDFFWLPASKEAGARLFSVEPTDQLAERDPRSPKARIWRSDNRIVARPVEIEREIRGYFGEEELRFIRLVAPVEVRDWGGDGRFEALLVGGVPRPAVVFENLRLHQGGDVRLLTAAPRGLEELHRSPLMGRAVAAASSWWSVGGRRFWVAAVWTRHRSLFKRPETRLLLLDPESGDLLPAAEALRVVVSAPAAVEEAAPVEEAAAAP